jgi:hypothetical protein
MQGSGASSAQAESEDLRVTNLFTVVESIQSGRCRLLQEPLSFSHANWWTGRDSDSGAALHFVLLQYRLVPVTRSSS